MVAHHPLSLEAIAQQGLLAGELERNRDVAQRRGVGGDGAGDAQAAQVAGTVEAAGALATAEAQQQAAEGRARAGVIRLLLAVRVLHAGVSVTSSRAQAGTIGIPVCEIARALCASTAMAAVRTEAGAWGIEQSCRRGPRGQRQAEGCRRGREVVEGAGQAVRTQVGRIGQQGELRRDEIDAVTSRRGATGGNGGSTIDGSCVCAIRVRRIDGKTASIVAAHCRASRVVHASRGTIMAGLRTTARRTGARSVRAIRIRCAGRMPCATGAMPGTLGLDMVAAEREGVRQ